MLQFQTITSPKWNNNWTIVLGFNDSCQSNTQTNYRIQLFPTSLAVTKGILVSFYYCTALTDMFKFSALSCLIWCAATNTTTNFEKKKRWNKYAPYMLTFFFFFFFLVVAVVCLSKYSIEYLKNKVILNYQVTLYVGVWQAEAMWNITLYICCYCERTLNQAHCN